MRKIFAFTMMMTFASFSQQNLASQSLSHDEYLKKSKNQKKGAWLLLGGGAALMVIGIASISTEDAANYVFGGDKSGFNTGAVLFYTGVVAGLGSIPLFIASGRNKRKAMAATVFLKMGTTPTVRNTSIFSHAYPALTLKIGLP